MAPLAPNTAMFWGVCVMDVAECGFTRLRASANAGSPARNDQSKSISKTLPLAGLQVNLDFVFPVVENGFGLDVIPRQFQFDDGVSLGSGPIAFG